MPQRSTEDLQLGSLGSLENGYPLYGVVSVWRVTTGFQDFVYLSAECGTGDGIHDSDFQTTPV